MEIWTPESARETPKPRFQCRICHDRFVLDTAYEQHVIKCSRIYEAQLAEWAAEKKADLDDIPDPEWRDYNDALRNAGIDPDVQFNRGRKSNIRRASES